MPLWLAALAFKNAVLVAENILLFVWKFCTDPPKRGGGYYARSGGGRSKRVRLKRGSGERFFQH